MESPSAGSVADEFAGCYSYFERIVEGGSWAVHEVGGDR